MIRKVCAAVGHVWRERVLDPVTTVHLFVLQILHGNTACSQVPRLARWLAAARRIAKHVSASLCTSSCVCCVRSASIWAAVRCSMTDVGMAIARFSSMVQAFRCPTRLRCKPSSDNQEFETRGCGFPVMHLLALFHASTGFLLNVLGDPLRTHDISGVAHVHPDLAEDDILVGDRGFSSFAHLALLAARKVFGVFRGHQVQIIDFRPHRRHSRRFSRRSSQHRNNGRPTSRWLQRLGRHDQLVEYVKPDHRPGWLTAEAYTALPKTMTVRELRFTVAERGRRTRVITLVTTLLDPQRYPAPELAALYGQRWQIETNFRHLKQTMRMDVLRCQTVDGVKKELTMYALVYNLVRLVMLEAARSQNVPVKQISFIDALRWLADAIYGATELRLRLIPERTGRLEPRAIKRRPKAYPFMTQPRDKLRKRLLVKKVAS